MTLKMSPKSMETPQHFSDYITVKYGAKAVNSSSAYQFAKPKEAHYKHLENLAG